MIKNINLDKLKSLKNPKLIKKAIATGALVVSILAVGITGCGKKGESPIIDDTPITTEVPTTVPTATPAPTVNPTEAPTATPAPTEVPVVEEITELDIEQFNKLVATVEASNKEAGLNLRKENLELAVYINNQNIATPELAQKIESSFDYNEEAIINSYLQTMTAYDNDMLEFYNGEDTKYADVSIMFLDKIDRETIRYIDSLGAKVYTYSAYTEGKTEETMAAEKAEVESVIKELQGYMMENNTINGYTKDQLTVGGLFGSKLRGDNLLAFVATTGYASEYEKNINDIAKANVEACVSRTYAILGSKSALVECEENVKTK